MRKRRYNAASAYVSAERPVMAAIRAFYAAVAMWFMKPVYRPSVAPVQPRAPIPWSPGGPPESVERLHKHGNEARWYLSRLVRGESVSRRDCQKAGMTQGGWLRGRRLLQRANVISRYDGRLLVDKRQAFAMLRLFLSEADYKLRTSRHTSP